MIRNPISFMYTPQPEWFPTALCRVTRRGPILAVEVTDDGVGGAVVHRSGGLAGLADRVRAVEGTLRLASPAGGPTTLLAELPCAS